MTKALPFVALFGGMKRMLIPPLLLFPWLCLSQNRSVTAFADSIRKAHQIPELGYAVLSSTRVLALEVLGNKQANSPVRAQRSDRFRIGSNTKTVTSLLAAVLVRRGQIAWDTKFFDLFPERKARSNSAYYPLTLLQLLTLRAPLVSYTYTDAQPTPDQIGGNEREQRNQFIAWVLAQPPAAYPETFHWSNPSYVLAGAMLEKASGKSYQQLVASLNKLTGTDFRFGQPNAADPAQPWGHDEQLVAEPPGENHKLNWLLAAGNLNATLPGYTRFIRLHLRGLRGKSKLLPAREFAFLHYGLPEFAVGWFWYRDEAGRNVSFHRGNPGTFLTKVYICKEEDKAYIFFANVQSGAAEKGLTLLYEALSRQYSR
jgi:CubicO group peptidase (beta-lactamase class C family)